MLKRKKRTIWVLWKKIKQKFGTDVVEGPVEKLARNEIVEAMQRMKSGKATGPSEVSVEMIVTSDEIRVEVMMELCQLVLDGRGMPDEWKASVIVPIFKGKGDVMSCGSYRGVKLLEHAIKIVERVLERQLQTLVNLNEMQFEFMPGKKVSGCDIHFEKNARGISKEGQEVVYVCC